MIDYLQIDPEAKMTIINFKEGLNSYSLERIIEQIFKGCPELRGKLIIISSTDLQIIQMSKEELKTSESL